MLELVFGGKVLQQVPASFSVGSQSSSSLQSSGADLWTAGFPPPFIQKVVSEVPGSRLKFLQGNKRALNFILRLDEGCWRIPE